MAGTELTLRLPPELAEQLRVLAVASNHTVEDIVVCQLRAALAPTRRAEQVGVPSPLRCCTLLSSQESSIGAIQGRVARSGARGRATTLACRRVLLPRPAKLVPAPTCAALFRQPALTAAA